MGHLVKQCKFCVEKYAIEQNLDGFGDRITSGICSKCNGRAERLATHLKKELLPLVGGSIIASPSALEAKAIAVRDACINFVNRLKEEGLYSDQELKYAVLTKKGNIEIKPLDAYTRAFFNWIFSKAR